MPTRPDHAHAPRSPRRAHEFGEVGVHAAEAGALRHPARASLHTGTELELLGIDGTGFTSPDLLLDAVPSGDFEPADYGVRPVLTPPRRRSDNDLIDLGDRTLRALHIPWHSPGSMVLSDEMRGAHIPAYVDTMHRLLELDVAEVRAVTATR